MKKILFVAPEVTPYVSSGGLGEVIGSLPKALCKEYGEEADIRVICPLYSAISDEHKSKMTNVASTTIPLSWRWQYCGIFSLVENGVTFYFLDNEYYFKRARVYGEYDDAERYAFFCKAALEILPIIDFFPDVLHAHEWQSALTIIYLKRRYGLMDKYRDIKTVFTIHNIAYQGVYGFEILSDVFDLSPFDRDIVEYHEAVNLMKGAIICADKVSTVSPTYAKEILSPKFSSGLHHVLECNKGKLFGILNGIDRDMYNPSKDTELFANYSYKTVKKKNENKIGLQKMFGLPESDAPIISIAARLVAQKGLDLVSLAADEILKNDVQFIVLGTGDFHYESYFRNLSDRYKNKAVAAITYNQDLAKKLYAGSDMLLMPSKTEPCGISQMIACRYGTIPIVRETGGLYDTIRDVGWNDGTGIGFTFAPYSAVELSGAVSRAIAYYSVRDRWDALVKKAMVKDFSWKKAALEYIKLYEF